MNLIMLFLIVTFLRFGQSLAIWWFMMVLFRREFKKHGIGFLVSSICISLVLCSYNLVFHIKDPFLMFAFQWPLYLLSHVLICKKGIALSFIETTIGYWLYRIAETEIAVWFNWQHIITTQQAVTSLEPAILIQFVFPAIIILSAQMILVKRNIGYYFIPNKVMLNKWHWSIWSVNSIVILYFFRRILEELGTFKRGFYGLDEQPFMLGFIGVNLLLLWRFNQECWQSRYVKESISSPCRKKSTPLGLKKEGKHS